MKTSLILALGVLLAGCGSDATTGSETATGSAAASSAARTNSDPRVATIRQQHEQLLTKQKDYVAQLGQLTGHEKLSPAHIKDCENRFAAFVQQSQANLVALNQLNPSKAQDPAQITLVGQLAADEATIMSLAEKRVASIHDEHYLPK